MASDTKLITKVDKKAKAKPKKPNMFKRILKYLKEVLSELKRVNWPSRKDLISYTVAVLVFIIAMAIVVGLLDLGFGTLMKLIVD